MQKTVEKLDMAQEQVQVARPKLSVEQRFEPKLRHAEWLLLLVIALMLWTAGFVDLATHRSRDAIIFGIYSVPYALMLLVYLAGFWAWGRLIFPADSINLLRNGITVIQQHSWLGLGVFAAAFGLLASMLLVDRWANYPLLQGSVLIILVLGGLVLLFAKPYGVQTIQPWRKLLIGLFGVWFGIELVLQLLSLFGVLPLTSYAGLFTPFGRVYQHTEGLANNRTNRYGMYYPDLKLWPDSRRIMLTGDSYVLGSQVKPEQNMGIALERLLNPEKGRHNTEVIALGMPGYGPGVYAEPRMLPYSIVPLKPSEVVVYFHLANDLQTVTGPGQGVPFYQLQADGSVDAHPDTQALRHDVWHEVIRGYEPVHPLRTVLSHFFSVQLFDRMLPDRLKLTPAPHSFTLNTDSSNTEQPFGKSSFAFAQQADPQSDQSMSIAKAQLLSFKKALDEQGITLRVVTIPYFPQAFFRSNANWDTALPGYDLLRPEAELKRFATEQKIPFLGMGEYMRLKQMPGQEIQKLFMNAGTGHFNEAGHSFFAQATFECFYGQNAQSNAACLRGAQ